ncbi:hypothetical protein PilKf_01009 [Pillotina sp. SPG140]
MKLVFQNDDFNEVAPMFERADIIVFCTPLYYSTFPAQLKVVIDKMVSFFIGNKKLKIKEAILIVCGEADDIKEYDGIIKTYALILNYEHWKNNTILVVPNVTKIGDVKYTNSLENARNIGINIS